MTKNIKSYKWSSYNEYTVKAKIVNVKFALTMFDEETDKAVEKFERFNIVSNDDKCLEISK